MNTTNPTTTATVEYANLLLTTYLMIVKGHALVKIITDADDPRKTLAVFEKTDALLADVKSYHDDVPALYKPKSFEKSFKDLKYIFHNSNLFNRKIGE